MKDMTAPWWEDDGNDQKDPDDEWRELARRLARPGWGLTQREKEVLELMAQGLSNKEIARRMLISPSTVKSHASRVLYKLGVHSRLEAVLMWERDRHKRQD